jgi:hypothetical protein
MLIVHNTDVLPPGNGFDRCHECNDVHPPAIVVFVDEGGEVTGEETSKEAIQAAAALRELQRIGRAMLVNVVISVQRGTSDMVPSQMKKATALAICTRVKDDSELSYVFDWGRGLKSEDLRFPWQAYIQRGSESVLMFKSFLLLPKQITEIALATWELRPVMVADEVAIGGEAYSKRWTRPDIQEFMEGLRGGDGEGSAPAAVPTNPIDPDDLPQRATKPGMAEVNTALAVMGDALKDLGGDDPRFDRVLNMKGDAVLQELEAIAALPELDPRGQRPSERQPASDPDQEPGAEPTDRPQPEQPRTDTRRPPRSGYQDRYDFVVDLVRKAGAAGVTTGEVVAKTKEAGFTDRDTTVKDTLRDARIKGDITQPKAYGPWFAAGRTG